MATNKNKWKKIKNKNFYGNQGYWLLKSLNGLGCLRVEVSLLKGLVPFS